MKLPPRYIYYPVLLFSIYFAIDKVCLLDQVKMLSQPDATYLFFDYKAELLDELVKVDAEIRAESAEGSGLRKTMLVLGSSRLLYIDYARFSRNFPDWEMFNFSAPVTAPAYYLYILERTLERGVHPDYMLIEVDPFQFNEGSDAFVRSNLAYSFDMGFLLEHWSLFKQDEISYFLGRQLFAAYRYPPSPGIIWQRWKDPTDRVMLAMQLMDRYQRENRGAGKNIIPRDTWYEQDFARLEYTADRSVRWLYGNYTLSDRQFEFLEKLLALAAANNIQLTLLRPQVSRPMTRLLAERESLREPIDQWETRMTRLLDASDPTLVRYLDLTRRDDYQCNTFVDATHMAIDCYHPMLILVMRQYWEAVAAADQSAADF